MNDAGASQLHMDSSVNPSQVVMEFYTGPSDNPNPRFLEDRVSNEEDPGTVIERGAFSGSLERGDDKRNGNNAFAVAIEDHSLSDGRALLRESAKIMSEFHAEQRKGEKAMEKEENVYQQVRYLTFMLFGEKQSEVQEKLIERMVDKACLDQAMPVLVRNHLPPEVIDQIRQEIEQTTVVDLPTIDWTEVPYNTIPFDNRTEAQNQERSRALEQHQSTISTQMSAAEDLARFDTYVQKMVALQEAANERQDRIDANVKKLGEEFAAQVQREFRQDVRKALKYLEPAFMERREAIHYQLKENTPETKRFLNVRRADWRATLDEAANVVDIDPDGAYKQAMDAQQEINLSNDMTLYTIGLKINQNVHYNLWRDMVNQEYLKRLNKIWTDLLWRRDVANIPPFTSPAFIENTSL